MKINLTTLCKLTKPDKLTTLDKYILKQVIEVFVLGVVVFTSILFASDAFTSLIKQIQNLGLPVKMALMLILLNLPAVIVMTIPMSVLFATVMTVNKLCLQSEITVMKACGIGIKRIAKPIFSFAIVMAIITFFINETIVPVTTAQSKTLALYSLVQRNIPEGKRNFTIKELKDGNYLKRLFYVEKCEDKLFENVSILDLSDKKQIQILQAKSGTSVVEGWQFDNASVYTISKEGKTLNTSWIEKTIVDFGSDIQRQLNKKNDGSDLNVVQLMPYLGKASNDDDEKLTLAKYKVKFWEKIALPFTTIVLVLLGIPLAITPPRVRHNRGFLFSIAIIFFYYVARTVSMTFGYNETISPFLSANLPNIVLGIIGYYLYKRKCEHI
ncbi:LptF/LptG family permease [bacterium]|nr:LptF/LptG family permease [bacterium]